MNCAWCSPSNNGSDGICDACMLLYFGVDPTTIHAEIAAEEAKHEGQAAGSYGSLAAPSNESYLDHGMLYRCNFPATGYGTPRSGEKKGRRQAVECVARNTVAAHC